LYIRGGDLPVEELSILVDFAEAHPVETAFCFLTMLGVVIFVCERVILGRKFRICPRLAFS
jgi:hypothetical protein